MSSPSTQFATSRSMGIYDPLNQISMWEDSFKGDISPNTGASTVVQVDTRLDNKVQRRLAQNREAARKSRLRKKVYVQQLETSRLKLAQLEQELERARQPGMYIGAALDTGHFGLSGSVNSGIAAFEMEYGHWVEEQQKKTCELRNVLQAHISDIELRMLVESGLNHYYDLFRMKAVAARADVFYLMSGIWRTSVERFFLWIGGFRPSELVNVLMPQLEPLTDQQLMGVCNLRLSSQQAEDALSQGMEKLQQTLAQSVTADPIDAGSYSSQMASGLEILEALESFVNQADHLRQQTLQQMSRILTTRQAARGLLALGEYFQRLHALSSLWAASPREPA
uniref:Putative transcription factor TGA4 n=1 Tax=Davidia involucrata TaxID=16924 RepID=A0A5B7A2Q9_DAVIN